MDTGKLIGKYRETFLKEREGRRGRKKRNRADEEGERAEPGQRLIGRVIPIRPHESIPVRRPRTFDIQIIEQWTLPLKRRSRLHRAKGTNLNNHNHDNAPEDPESNERGLLEACNVANEKGTKETSRKARFILWVTKETRGTARR